MGSNKEYSIIYRSVLPIILMVCAVLCCISFPHIIVNKNSEFRYLSEEGILKIFADAWNTINWGDKQSWMFVVGFFVWSVASEFLPGKHFFGPECKDGHRPEYWKSAKLYYLITSAIAIPIIVLTPMLPWYYKAPTISGILTVASVTLSVIFYIKGLIYPSPGPHDTTGNPIYDFWFGVELYPRTGRYIDWKKTINMRFASMLLQVFLWMWLKACYENSQFNYYFTLLVFMCSIYIFRYIALWEEGYMGCIDMIDDRLGFYLCFGYIGGVSVYYHFACLHMVKHPIDNNSFGLGLATLVLVLCSLTWWLETLTDEEKILARSTNGKCNIWGKPAKVIRAVYLDNFGNEKRSLLLASGFWGLARHFNHGIEIVWTLILSMPGLLVHEVYWLYPIAITAFFIHRQYRDDVKCSKKYGKYWDEYCKLVPYRLLPYIY